MWAQGQQRNMGMCLHANITGVAAGMHHATVCQKTTEYNNRFAEPYPSALQTVMHTGPEACTHTN